MPQEWCSEKRVTVLIVLKELCGLVWLRIGDRTEQEKFWSYFFSLNRQLLDLKQRWREDWRDALDASRGLDSLPFREAAKVEASRLWKTGFRIWNLEAVRKEKKRMALRFGIQGERPKTRDSRRETQNEIQNLIQTIRLLRLTRWDQGGQQVPQMTREWSRR